MVMLRRKLLLILIIKVFLIKNAFSYFKVNKIECRDINPKLAEVKECRLKPIKRDVSEMTVRVKILKTLYKVNIHIELLRKYNTYQPFFINNTFDLCAFFKARKQAVYLDILFKLIDGFTNANHTCPYEGEFILDHFRPLHKQLILPIPSGEYLIKYGLYEGNIVCGYIYTWFSFRELENWEKSNKKPKNSKSLQ